MSPTIDIKHGTVACGAFPVGELDILSLLTTVVATHFALINEMWTEVISGTSKWKL